MGNVKIVVTGMGAVTPIGIGVSTYWNNLISGACGIGRISKFDTSKMPVKIAAEIKNFDPKDYIPENIVEGMDDFMHYSFAAAAEALRDSALTVDPYRTGVVMGTAMDGLTTIGQTQAEWAMGTGKIGPRFMPKILGNVAAAHVAIVNGIKGPSMTVNTACSSGGDAIILAAMLLKAGEADAMVAMGGESGIGPLMIHSLARAMALSTNNDDPLHASRPFDLGRSGFVMGEGGGALILETEEHALKRGADIKAELAGYANNTDGFHVIAPDPYGRGGAACMRRALAVAGLSPDDIDYINAHGTSTIKGDAAETLAIKAAFENAELPPVSSTKGATGHMMGAGGITEAIACIQAIRSGILPPTLNYETPDPLCQLDVVPNKARPAKVQAAMSNAFGFGGQNSCIIMRKYQG